MISRRLVQVAIVGLVLAAGSSLAQEATPTPTTDLQMDDLDVSRIDEILRGEQEVLGGESFGYDPADRRDPFESLLDTRPGEAETESVRPPGLPGMKIEEVRVEGIIATSSGVLAFVQGRDKISYIIRPGTKLYNGEVVRITPEEVVFKQQVSDPKQLQPYEEVVRRLSE